jgi:enoyl-ACP reductase-like protein
MNTPMIRTPLENVYGSGGVEEMIRLRDAQVPMGKMGDAWDVAYAALFLASDEARYIYGRLPGCRWWFDLQVFVSNHFQHQPVQCSNISS